MISCKEEEEEDEEDMSSGETKDKKQEKMVKVWSDCYKGGNSGSWALKTRCIHNHLNWLLLFYFESK